MDRLESGQKSGHTFPVGHQYRTFDAKARLSEILRIVEAGEDVVITRHGRAIARVSPVRSQEGKKRRLGTAADEFTILPGFDEPITEEELLDG